MKPISEVRNTHIAQVEEPLPSNKPKAPVNQDRDEVEHQNRPQLLVSNAPERPKLSDRVQNFLDQHFSKSKKNNLEDRISTLETLLKKPSQTTESKKEILKQIALLHTELESMSKGFEKVLVTSRQALGSALSARDFRYTNLNDESIAQALEIDRQSRQRYEEDSRTMNLISTPEREAMHSSIGDALARIKSIYASEHVPNQVKDQEALTQLGDFRAYLQEADSSPRMERFVSQHHDTIQSSDDATNANMEKMFHGLDTLFNSPETLTEQDLKQLASILDQKGDLAKKRSKGFFTGQATENKSQKTIGERLNWYKDLARSIQEARAGTTRSGTDTQIKTFLDTHPTGAHTDRKGMRNMIRDLDQLLRVKGNSIPPEEMRSLYAHFQKELGSYVAKVAGKTVANLNPTDTLFGSKATKPSGGKVLKPDDVIAPDVDFVRDGVMHLPRNTNPKDLGVWGDAHNVGESLKQAIDTGNEPFNRLPPEQRHYKFDW